MALENINLGLLFIDHIVDGGSNGTLTVKGGVIRVGCHVRFLQIDVIVGDEAAAVAALHHQTVVFCGFVGVLLGEGGIDIGVFLDHLNVIGKTVVFAQQVFNDLVLFAGLHDPVDRDILLQGVDHHLGVAGNGIQLGCADVVLCHGRGQDGDQDIDHNQQCQHHGGNDQRVGTALKGNAVAPRVVSRMQEIPLFHQLYLLFSRDCTERNRKNAITEQ